MITRGIHSLWHLSVLDRLCPKCHTSRFHNYNTRHCVGGHHTVSSSSDCCKTLPWTATIFGRKHFRGLFHGVDENSPDLLCKVSSYCEYCSLCLLRDQTASFVPVSCFTLVVLLSPTNSVVCQHPLTSTRDYDHCCYRIRKLSFILASFKFKWSCSHLCWDHIWSLVFENIMLSSWPTLTSNCHDLNCFPGACAYIDWQWCVMQGVLDRVDGGCPLLCREQQENLFLFTSMFVLV
jgi:hypothetical protein